MKQLVPGRVQPVELIVGTQLVQNARKDLNGGRIISEGALCSMQENLVTDTLRMGSAVTMRGGPRAAEPTGADIEMLQKSSPYFKYDGVL